MRIPSYVFHVPNPQGKPIVDIKKLEELSRKANAPKFVDVIDCGSKTRLGRIPTALALIKYRP